MQSRDEVRQNLPVAVATEEQGSRGDSAFQHDQNVMVGSSLVTQIIRQLQNQVKAKAADRSVVKRLIDVNWRREERIKQATIVLDFDANGAIEAFESNPDIAALATEISVTDDVAEVLIEGDVQIGDG